MTYLDPPERAYLRAAEHWRICSRCSRVGGESADRKDLCPAGRRLTEAWEEERYVIQDGHGDWPQSETERRIVADLDPPARECPSCGWPAHAGDCR